uniref:K Homology domain-containing protein n=1 Tax=Acrobeloides nanus TaxID=290746 RepID=A0A914CG89_9BILA
MQIEVKQPNGIYMKAEIKKILPESLLVAYDVLLKPDENVAYENCRVLRQHPNGNRPFKIGEVVEAYIQKGELCGYQMAKILDIKGQFAVVESLNEPKAVEIITFDSCRDGNLTTPLSFEKMKQFSIPVPDDMRSYFEQPDSFKDLYDTIESIHIDYDSDDGNIIFWSHSDAIIRKVKILSDFFMSDSRQKMQFLQRKEHVKKVDKFDNGKVAQYVEEFDILSDLMGLAIGSQGTNFARARHVEGINEIVYHQSSVDEDYVTVKIFSENSEAAEQARCILEYVLHSVEVPRRMMSRIIGKNGATIQEIVDKSGVIRVQVEDDDHESEKVNFIFTGTKETVSNAELLIQFHLKHLKEMQEMRDELNHSVPRNAPPPLQQHNSSATISSTTSKNIFLESLKQLGNNSSSRGRNTNGNFVDYNGDSRGRGRGRRGGGSQRWRGNREPLGAAYDESY